MSKSKLSRRSDRKPTVGETPSSARDTNGSFKFQEVEKQWANRTMEATKREAERKRIAIWKRPLTTIWLFLIVAYHTLLSYAQWVFKRREFTLLPVILLVAISYNLRRFRNTAVREWQEDMDTNMAYVVWWVGLGVLSSIGLGTGMHSGMLFLFPHILKVALFAEGCGHTNFDSRINMWQAAVTHHVHFECGTGGADAAPPSFTNLFLKLLPAGFLWGAGTALGEIPPYLVSYSAAKLGNQHNEELSELEQSHDLLTVMKRKMIAILKRFGFWGVLAFSAYPNAAFDLCGICCGHFMMPFAAFFGGTFVGKAMIKAPGQVAGAVAVFGSTTRKALIAWLATVLSSERHRFVVDKIESSIRKFQEISEKGAEKGDEPKGGFHLGQLWNLFVMGLVGYFALSIVHQFARGRQLEVDTKYLDKKYPLTVKQTKKDVTA
mmetsp:Transcript_35469/g.59778  ORF Transcript_35469/g.59778 Transcript_35469/m.59778 type:complete len:435 (+) Transcript_35469:120-1424(+)